MTPPGDRRHRPPPVEVTIYCGGPGNDLLYGQAGDDRLFGGTLNDQLWEEVRDDLRGGLSKDKLRGDPASGISGKMPSS